MEDIDRPTTAFMGPAMDSLGGITKSPTSSGNAGFHASASRSGRGRYITESHSSQREVNHADVSSPKAFKYHHPSTLSGRSAIGEMDDASSGENRTGRQFDKPSAKKNWSWSLLVVLTCMCLMHWVPHVGANTPGLLPLMHATNLPDSHSNLSVPCPSKCLCVEAVGEGGGLRVDCSGQNLTAVPAEIHPSTTHL
ncbi:hypothetical protein BaRGS_00029022 [Batillaria attramentaria]|uniref:LRRNT domain-containing protein n=1 Tax=Batillaria attramentaria TaxID=370345 RepID=A0ABD0JYM6_9CAEN